MSVKEAHNSRHVKFDDDYEGGDLGKAEVAKKVDYDSDESEDDDDAPQEEGLSSGKSTIEDELRDREEALRREQRELKEKRRKNDARLREQQLTKEARTRSTDELPEELPEELSEEFFEKLDQEKHLKPVEQIPKHINFNDIDTEQYLPEVKKQLERKRKNTLKRLRATTVKRGSFNVTLLDNSNISKMAPKREAAIMNTKDKWLKRKAIKRK